MGSCVIQKRLSVMVRINLPLCQPVALRTWMDRTDTGPSLAPSPTSLLFPCLRTGSTGRTGTHTRWRRPTSSPANSGQSWATTPTGRTTFTSFIRTGSLAVRSPTLFIISYSSDSPVRPMFFFPKTPYFAGENPCSSHHLTCSHLCLIGPGGKHATCECPDHFIGLAVGFKVQCVADCSSTQFRCGDNEKSVAYKVA